MPKGLLVRLHPVLILVFICRAKQPHGLRRMWAKARKNPDPGPVDTAKLLPIGQGVFILLLIVGCLLIWADIAAPV